MHNISSKIQTTKTIYPQIYAYVLPTLSEKNGWIKIGYTERKDVEKRITEQTKTAAIDLPHQTLWHYPAKFTDDANQEKWFKDYQFHHYLRTFKEINSKKEWFFYNGNPDQARLDFIDFTQKKFDQSKIDSRDYQLRSEQLNAIEQTLNYFNHNPNSEFLWNAKPRFGKTLTTYDLARKMDARSVLIVTNRPAIANSWFDDFETFIAHQTKYRFISTTDSLKNRKTLTREQFINDENTGYQITFISLQDLKGSIHFSADGTIDKLKWVTEITWDLLVIDEAHEGVDTHKTDIAFDEINRKFTLHLSGTPFKALAKGNFTQDQIFNWTYTDEQHAKENWLDPEQANPYEKLPRLNLFSYQMSQMITDKVNQGANIDGDNVDYAFDLNEFFTTKENGRFKYEESVIKWLNTLTHNEKYPFSTPELRNELKHTFWLLNRVDSAKALASLLKKHPVFENYEIILAAGDGKSEENESKNPQTNLKALDKVKSAVKEYEKTITLSVGQLTTGITIPEWSAVMMLSNLKSPALYMQAAFRSQNPWQYEDNGQLYQKENAYVFDFAPERTLIIYDDFANNLSPNTTNGNGTTEDRENNIRTLLNFFPVIAEDNQGKMVELDVNQVLTIPKTIKAQEVVKRGFMSNFLFQNISQIFNASGEVKAILEQLSPVEESKIKKSNKPIDTQGIEVNNNGEINIAENIILSTTEARFGEKIYTHIPDLSQSIEENKDKQNLVDIITQHIKQTDIGEATKSLAKEQGITTKQADRIIDRGSEAIARQIQKVQDQTTIKQNSVKIEYQKAIKEASHNQTAIKEAEAKYEAQMQQIREESQQAVESTLKSAMSAFAQQTTQTMLETAEEKKKDKVEDDIRARLRGFSCTIPAFLMAYGQSDTTLANFDHIIEDQIFKEVTGITLEQFRLLRDEHQFFDEIVFDQSIQEFLNKRQMLANYFDESQTEDIFDYIPPQKTNQIFTPKKVVKIMVDQLEIEDPYIFQDPNKTFADLYMKSGLYITEIVKRLYRGLESHIPDPENRLKHILENQVYGFAPTKIIYNIAKNFIFGFDEKAKQINTNHIVYLDTTPYAKGETKMSLEEKLDQLFK
ncbi:DEAD/DEAH box helicase family protein [Rodentibacter caecimuris]|uniref:DEAD/DEAH box helicase family protein n=1 Tax=Rodentibacter caecimuris TaxID=1796644 RepID=UPI002248F927|nr:DEAD/DEAH box helicase family protein [Rodentibacter heylii]MCX2962308.1 DEAD/DEAH box helicase family protein [Rodentibacter heylii]